MTNAPGKSHRKGITVFELMEMFPDDTAAREWLEATIWENGERVCGHCGSCNTHHLKNEKPMPYQCRDCRKFFSIRTGTVMAQSKIPLRKWVYAIYLWASSLKGVSSMKLYRDLGITQKSAWFMAHRLREAFKQGGGMFAGPVEADETYVGGLEKNKHQNKKLHAGRGGVGKTIIVGVKDRDTNTVKAEVVDKSDATTLQGLVKSHARKNARIYTDEHRAYCGLDNHSSVKHSANEYVRGDIHTNGIESFWSLFKRSYHVKRSYHGTFHHISAKHMQRYINEFTGRHNIRKKDTIDQMTSIVAGMIGRRLTYAQLTKGR